ncbi:MAG: cation:proton antiporter [Candidatus Undinarchaeales archaeon]
MLTKLLLTIVVILLSAKLGGALAKKLGQSTVIGEILAGIIIGPILLGKFFFLDISSPVIYTLAEIGLVFLLFLVGLKLDIKTFEKFAMTNVLTAFLGVMLPFSLGTLLAFNLFNWTPIQSLLLGGILMATSIGVTARLLDDRNLTRTKAGMAISDAAVLESIITIVVITFLLGFGTTQISTFNQFIFASLKIFVFFVAIIFLGQRVGGYIITLGEKLNLRVKEGLLSVVLVLIFSLSYISDALGLSMLIGAFLAGVILDERHLKKIEHEVYSMTYGLFVPIFFVYIGALVDPVLIYHNLWWILPIFVVAVVGKFIGSFIGSLLTEVKVKDCFKIGVGMIPRGEIAIILTGLAAQNGIFASEIYTAIISALLLTIIITPPLFTLVTKK